jgi:hypothetical protein
VTTTVVPIPFAGSILTDYRHVCAFFSSPKEEYQTLLPFIVDGLQRGERAYHVLPSQYEDEHLEQLRGAGVDVTAAQQRRQLEVATPDETYLRGGRFNEDAMLALGPRLGFPLTRMIAHAETVLEDWSKVDEWIEYETWVSKVLPGYDDVVICTYDTNLLNGAVAFDIFCRHPVVILGGLLYQNPFFVEPDELIIQLQQRSGVPRKPYRA